MIRRVVITCGMVFASPAAASPEEDAFVEANIIGIFYHELGHAAIDLLNLPVFGQEEDAADVASVIMIDAFWEPDAALDLAYDAAFGFAAEAQLAEEDGAPVAYWAVHGPDEQRFYNTVCLFYGGDPEGRAEFAEDMGLPEERAEDCPFEYEQAVDSWGGALDTLAEPGGSPIQFKPGGHPVVDPILFAEVEALNEAFGWPEPLVLKTESCGEANAFYDPEAREVVFCDEFVPHLRSLFQLIQ